MPKLTGIFSSFDLEQIPPEDIARWLKSNPPLSQVENFIANRILYPACIPYSQADLALELAILREVIQRHPDKFQMPGKLLITKQWAERINLADLTLALVDALRPKGVVTVLVGSMAVGSVIRPNVSGNGSFSLEIEGKKYEFKKGGLVPVACPTQRCHIRFVGSNAKISGKNDLVFETFGGKLGLLVDGRAI